jgi:hypothetical protein
MEKGRTGSEIDRICMHSLNIGSINMKAMPRPNQGLTFSVFFAMSKMTTP